MTALLGDLAVGRKNALFGMGLFVLLGIGAGIPLTIDFFGGSVLTREQYQLWKVIHGYGIFLGFINYFFGLIIDRLPLTRTQKEVSSWSFLIAAVFGGLGRMGLALVSAEAFATFGVYASLGEVVFITLGTLLFISGQLRARSEAGMDRGSAQRRLAA